MSTTQRVNAAIENPSPWWGQPAWVLLSASADRPLPELSLSEQRHIHAATPQAGPEQLLWQIQRLRRLELEGEANQTLAHLPLETIHHPWLLLEWGRLQQQRGNHAAAQEAWKRCLPTAASDLHLCRELIKACPALLSQSATMQPPQQPAAWRVAVILPGELRCLEHSRALLEKLGEDADVFICTTETFKEQAESLRIGKLKRSLIINEGDRWHQLEEGLPQPSMRQWFKLTLCLQLLRHSEQQQGVSYSHIIKLRSDYHHLNPESLWQDLLNTKSSLIAASDKVFGGPRETMLRLDTFLMAGCENYLDSSLYRPISVEPILGSDDAIKWYGFRFPRQLVGSPSTTQQLRTTLCHGGASLAEALERHETSSEDTYVQLVQGHPEFASEIAFAHFLNRQGIHVHSAPSLLGLLLPHRHELVQKVPGTGD